MKNKLIFINLLLIIFTSFVMSTQEVVKIDKDKYKKAIEGMVVDEDGIGIYDATVILVEKNISTRTSRTGRFVIEFLGGGVLHIEVSKPGYLPYSTDFYKTGKKVLIKLPKIVLVSSPLEEVVVTGTATPKKYREAPVKTAVATKKEIEKQGAQTLADALEMFTGVRVENNCQNCNFTQVRINGMEGKYSQILINSLPVFSALAGVYGLEQIPSGMVEKIEVVKGGGSALYGGNAVAGVVNIILREPVKSGSQFSFSQGFINSTEPDTLFDFNNDYVSKDLNSRVTFFAHYQRREPMDYDEDGFSDLGELTNVSFGSNFSHFFSAVNGKFKLNASAIFEDRRGGNKFDLPPHFADIAEAIQTYRVDVGVGWEQIFRKSSVLKINQVYSYTKRESYYGAEQDPDAYGLTDNPLFYTDIKYNNFSLKNHNVLVGLNYRSDKLNDSAPAYGRVIDETYTNLGFFIQDEISLLNKKVSLLAGVRADKHSEVGNIIFSPRASFLYKGIRNITFRASYSSGFRAPQVFDEDLHITQTGGEGMLIINSDDLKEEQSHSITLGIDFGLQKNGMVYQFSVGGFYNWLADTFTLREVDEIEKARVFERFNSGGAKVYGLEVEAGFILAGKFEFSTGWTFQKSQYDEPEPDFNSEDFFRTPELYGHLRLDWHIFKNWELIADLNYTGSMKVPHFAGYIEEDILEESDPFMVINLHINKKIGFNNGSV
ncbi:MAG: TonB-dependent receptor, partial [Candidatus Aminicenantes bacterium]|nr:TonB-dependent receptor [Candidatus Aminicenantes bacterium]